MKNPLVRLVNGSTKYEGRVELFRNGTWATLCQIKWTMYDAKQICRELGFGREIRVRPHGYYGESNGPFWFRSINSVNVVRTCNNRRRYDELNLKCALPGTYVCKCFGKIAQYTSVFVIVYSSSC